MIRIRMAHRVVVVNRRRRQDQVQVVPDFIVEWPPVDCLAIFLDQVVAILIVGLALQLVGSETLTEDTILVLALHRVTQVANRKLEPHQGLGVLDDVNIIIYDINPFNKSLLQLYYHFYRGTQLYQYILGQFTSLCYNF